MISRAMLNAAMPLFACWGDLTFVDFALRNIPAITRQVLRLLELAHRDAATPGEVHKAISGVAVAWALVTEMESEFYGKIDALSAVQRQVYRAIADHAMEPNRRGQRENNRNPIPYGNLGTDEINGALVALRGCNLIFIHHDQVFATRPPGQGGWWKHARYNCAVMELMKLTV